jgi:hypothetical protein
MSVAVNLLNPTTRFKVGEAVAFTVFALTALFILFVCMFPANEYEGMGLDGIDCDSFHHIVLPLPCALLVIGAVFYARRMRVYGVSSLRVLGLLACLIPLAPSAYQIRASLREQDRCEAEGDR